MSRRLTLLFASPSTLRNAERAPDMWLFCRRCANLRSRDRGRARTAPSWSDTDWAEIVGLYDVLLALWPSPVVELNRAIAVGLRDGPQAGLDALSPLLAEPALATYAYLSAARGDFLRQLEHWPQAAHAYREALALNDNDVERRFLAERLDVVESRRARG
jgi:predicted RNA polymerase sigma factor